MPIPKTAKKVFQGEIFSVYQWQQKMFDGTFKTFERVKRQDTVIIIASAKDKIVMLEQMQPGTKWFHCTPSGRMDIPGEKPEAAAKRELLEETGMVAKKLFLWKKVQSKSKVESTIYFFIARDCRIVAKQNLDNGEKIKIKLVSFEQYLKLSENPDSHMELSLIDMFKARLDKKYKVYLKRTIFG
jgi:ADP-ribose pyrophosphatase